MDIFEEFWKARKDCKSDDVYLAPGVDYARIGGRSASRERSMRQVVCVRTYLCEHGWTEGEGRPKSSPRARAGTDRGQGMTVEQTRDARKGDMTSILQALGALVYGSPRAELTPCILLRLCEIGTRCRPLRQLEGDLARRSPSASGEPPWRRVGVE